MYMCMCVCVCVMVQQVMKMEQKHKSLLKLLEKDLELTHRLVRLLL